MYGISEEEKKITELKAENHELRKMYFSLLEMIKGDYLAKDAKESVKLKSKTG